MTAEDMEFTVKKHIIRFIDISILSVDFKTVSYIQKPSFLQVILKSENISTYEVGNRETYLPQSAVYATLTTISVSSWILGIGRSSTATSYGPLNTTARIVFLVDVVSILNDLLVSVERQITTLGR